MLKKPPLKFQCVLCGYQCPENTEPPDTCPDCNCPKFREVTLMAPADHPSPESVAHLKKKMENCPNYDVGEGGGKQYHRLVLERTINYTKAKVSSDPKLCDITIQERCKECHQLYTQHVVPLSRPDSLEKLGILKEVEEHLGKKLVTPAP
jgi:predicted  nucleic acid-binding Zn-ribbon protein